MEKRRNKEIILIGIFVIILGGWLFPQSVTGFLYSLKEDSNELTLLRIISECIFMLFPLCLIVGGISFLLLKKWAIYLVRTCLFLLIAVGLLITLSALFIGFVGLPPISFYLIMLAGIVALCLVTRTKIKEQFEDLRQRNSEPNQ